MVDARWYCRYGISDRDWQEMVSERGINVCHTTLYRWVQKYVPLLEKRLRCYKNKFQRKDKLHLDETYIRVKGRWCGLYRAVNQSGETLDFYLSTTRDTQAAKAFLKKIFKACKLPSDYPRVVVTDKSGSYRAALQQLKQTRVCPQFIQQRTHKYLNNRIEADQGQLKQLLHPLRGFKSFLTANRTLKGFELMRMFRKGPFKIFQRQEGIAGEIHLIEQQFVF